MLYFAYGLCIRSNIPLPQLTPVKRTDKVEVDADVRKLKPSVDPQDFPDRPQFDVQAHTASLFWPSIGKFQVRQGREIIIEPLVGVADDLLRPFLLATALPLLLMQRKLFVLHASAVTLLSPRRPESAVAFMGHSGQGKSTMATALNRKGHRVLADDTIAFPVPQQGAPLLYSAIPHLKLRGPSLEAFGEDPTNLPRWSESDDSFVLRLPVKRSLEPAPLRSLYVLEDSSSLTVELLPLPEALLFLMQHAYCMGLLPDGEMGESLEACIQITQHIPIFRLRRPRDFNRLPDVIRLIEEHQESLSLPETMPFA